MASKYRVTVNVSEAEYKELSALSEKHRVGLSWLGREAITEFLSRHQQQDLQLPLAFSANGVENNER